MGTIVASLPARPPAGRLRLVAATLATEWRELGGLGRLATVGLLASGMVAIVLGVSIQAAVRHHLLDVRTELIEGVLSSLAADGLLPVGTGSEYSRRALDAAVEHRLIGGEITRVAIRDAGGNAVYGTPREHAAGEAVPVYERHAEQHGDRQLHFRLPIHSPQGAVVGTFEVFQQAESLDAVLARVRRNVWLSISTGLGTLGLAMGAVTLSHGRALDRRRRHAEELLRELLHAEDAERHRIVGALHDDIGQPLYRVLYGLEGCRAKTHGDAAVAAELGRLAALVRDVDGRLRNELRNLHRSSLEQLDLRSALEAIARDCRDDCELAVDVDIDVVRDPSPGARSVLLRAVEEALTNVRKHAAASRVVIRARASATKATVQVVDDGLGYGAQRGLGLTTTRERLEAIGGCLTVAAGDRGGTVFTASVPAAEVRQ